MDIPHLRFALCCCNSIQEEQTTGSLITRVVVLALGTIALTMGILILAGVPGLCDVGTIGGGIFSGAGIFALLAVLCIKSVKESQGAHNPNTRLPNQTEESKNDHLRKNTQKTFHHTDIIGSGAFTHLEFGASSGRYLEVRKRLVKKYKTENFDVLSKEIYGCSVMINMYSKSTDESDWNADYIVETISLYLLSEEEMLKLPLQEISRYDQNQKAVLASRIQIPLFPGYKHGLKIENPYPDQGNETLGHLLSSMSINDLKRFGSVEKKLLSLEIL